MDALGSTFSYSDNLILGDYDNPNLVNSGGEPNGIGSIVPSNWNIILLPVTAAVVCLSILDQDSFYQVCTL